MPRGIILNGIGSPTELCRSDNVVLGPPTPPSAAASRGRVHSAVDRAQISKPDPHRSISPAALQSRVSSSYLVVDAGGTSL